MNAQNLNAWRTGAFAAACALAAAGRPALGQFSFASALVPAGTQPTGIAAADFDNDGDMDAATTVDGPERIVVLLNNGAGVFAAGPASPLPASSSPQDLIAGDFDGDGDRDLAVALRDPQGAIRIMLNNGSALFTAAGDVIVGDRPRGLSIGDLERDGDMDLAVANRDSNSASVLTNSGGSFTAVTVAVGGEARSTALADVNGDGDLDLAVTNHDGASIAIFSNSGGSFSLAMTLPVGPVVRPDGITSADLDNDGDPDLAAAASDQSLAIGRAIVFLNSGAGFAGPFPYDTAGQNTSHIVAGDLDCDGLRDLVTANTDSDNVSVLRNVGAGSFGLPQVARAGTEPEEITLADTDDDGDPDILVANRSSNDVSVLNNQTCTPCPADVDGDGTVSITDLLSLLAAWGPNPGHPADIDGNGTVAMPDLLALLAAWGPCP